MRRLAKKIAAAVMALTLAMAMTTSCFAATWGSYFGANVGWYEGAEGALTQESATGWTAKLTMLGYGGCWGGQVFQDNSQGYGKVDVKKGQTYTLSFTMQSTLCNKWVLIKIATGDNYAYGKWIQLRKGETYNFKETFVAKCDANAVYFGIGGDMGDRIGVTTDPDAEYRYSLINQKISDEDPTYSTEITCKNFSLSGKLKAVKNKKTNIKNLNKFLKTSGKITAKQSGFKCTIKRSGSAVVLQAKKGKVKVNIKLKTSNYKKAFKKMNKKAAKALDKVLKANTGLTLKNLGK